jgi:LysR family transcriptional activator of nhaA
MRAYNHPLGECEVTWVGTPAVAKAYRRGFPKSLDGAPILLPTDDTAVRRDLDQWCAAQGIRPVVVGEFEDYALLRVFGRKGMGAFPVFRILEKELRRHDGLEHIGLAKGVKGRFYAISVEKKVRHPAVATIYEAARRSLFSA